MTHLLRLGGIAALLAASATAAAAGSDERAAGAPDPAPTAALADPARPHLVDRTLYWSDPELAAICASFGGRFAKLPGSAIYACRPDGIAPARHAALTR